MLSAGARDDTAGFGTQLRREAPQDRSKHCEPSCIGAAMV